MGNCGEFKQTLGTFNVGDRFGDLEVIEVQGRHKGALYVSCRCILCEGTSTPTGSNLRRGKSTRCAKCARKKSAATNTKYPIEAATPKTRRRLQKRIAAIIGRCTNPNNSAYEQYGARGIRVHPPWLEDRRKFFLYLLTLDGAENPEATIDRRNNDDAYKPGNIRFVSYVQQQNNRQDTVWIEYNGERLSTNDFRRKYAPDYQRNHTINRKLREGKSPEAVIEDQKYCKGAYGPRIRSGKLRGEKSVHGVHQ